METRRALVGTLVWAVAVVGWSTLGAAASTSRLAGTVLLVVLPAVVLLRAVRPVGVGLLAGGVTLLAAGVLLGADSGASIGLAVGASTTWAAVAWARSTTGPWDRGAAVVLAATGTALTLAPSLGPAGPRVAGAVVALAAGAVVGGRVGGHGAQTPPVRTVGESGSRVTLVRSGAVLLVLLGIVRSLVDLDAPAVRVLLAMRRAASLVLPAGDGLVTVGTVGLAVLPWLVPLVGAGVALALAEPIRTGSTVPSRSLHRTVPPLPGGLVVALAAGITATLLLDLVAVNWAAAWPTGAGGAAWPARHVETLLWSGLALVFGAPAAAHGVPHAGSPRTLTPAAATVTTLTAALLLVVLVSEWRVDGVALRPSLLAVPAAFVGLVALARGGVVRVASGIAIAGLPVLALGLMAGASATGPVFSGRRSLVPGEGALLMDGRRLAGLLPDAGQLGMVGAALVLTGALLVLAARADGDRWALALGTVTFVLAGVSVILAEAKMAMLALGVALAVAVVVPRVSVLATLGARPAWRRGAGAGVGLLTVAAPFVGAAVLDPTAFRPEVWRRSITSLTAGEWLVGLGAQPLRGDRAFHARVDTSWGAVQAHNQTVELLLMVGVPGLALMFAFAVALTSVGLRLARRAQGWPLAVATFTVLAGASGPNLTYFGHDVATVLTLGLLVAVAASPPRLVRLDDDPATLPDALARVWAAGDAAIVMPPDHPITVPPGVTPGVTLPAGTALVVPTSGSTGTPRAIVLTHVALDASTAASIAALGCRPGERWALALPLRHVAGLQVLARARALGTPVHVVPDPGDPAVIAAAADHAEHVALVPTQLVRCLDAGEDVVRALARFRTVLVGGGPLAPERLAQARDAGVHVVLSYGMTETCGGCVYDGRPLPGVDVAVEGSGGAPGRIRLRGPMLAAGSLDAADDAARFTPDGWFVTDDLGRITGDGTLEVLGRADTVINTGGVKVDPLAVEALLRGDPTVADAVVVGMPDAEWGERVVAVVVPADPDRLPTLEQLRARVTATLPPAHAPREVRSVERIVRDAMGKVSAAERERLRAG